MPGIVPSIFYNYSLSFNWGAETLTTQHSFYKSDLLDANEGLPQQKAYSENNSITIARQPDFTRVVATSKPMNCEDQTLQKGSNS